MIFQRRPRVVADDPGSRLINKMLMLGLMVFIGLSALSQKNAPAQVKWNAVYANQLSANVETVAVEENKEIELSLSDDDIKKLAALPRNNTGKTVVFKVRLAPQPVTQNLPAATPAATAKPNVTP